jgi:hypothetical protein
VLHAEDMFVSGQARKSVTKSVGKGQAGVDLRCRWVWSWKRFRVDSDWVRVIRIRGGGYDGRHCVMWQEPTDCVVQVVMAVANTLV